MMELDASWKKHNLSKSKNCCTLSQKNKYNKLGLLSTYEDPNNDF